MDGKTIICAKQVCTSENIIEYILNLTKINNGGMYGVICYLQRERWHPQILYTARIKVWDDDSEIPAAFEQKLSLFLYIIALICQGNHLGWQHNDFDQASTFLLTRLCFLAFICIAALLFLRTRLSTWLFGCTVMLLCEIQYVFNKTSLRPCTVCFILLLLLQVWVQSVMFLSAYSNTTPDSSRTPPNWSVRFSILISVHSEHLRTSRKEII